MLSVVWKGLPEDIWHWYVKAFLIDYREIWFIKMRKVRLIIKCKAPKMVRFSLTGSIERENEHIWSIETIDWKGLPMYPVYLYQIINI